MGVNTAASLCRNSWAAPSMSDKDNFSRKKTRLSKMWLISDPLPVMKTVKLSADKINISMVYFYVFFFLSFLVQWFPTCGPRHIIGDPWLLYQFGINRCLHNEKVTVMWYCNTAYKMVVHSLYI